MGLDFERAGWLLKLPDLRDAGAWKGATRGRERGYTEKLVYGVLSPVVQRDNEASRRWWTRR